MREIIAIAVLVLIVPCYLVAQNLIVPKELVTYSVQNTKAALAGKPFLIDVVLRIEPGWYVYAPTGTNAAQGMIETQVMYVVPEGLRRSGKMEIPDAIFHNGYEVFAGGEVIIRQPFKASKAGIYSIKGRIIYQTCSTGVCMTPVTDEFTATVNVN